MEGEKFLLRQTRKSSLNYKEICILEEKDPIVEQFTRVMHP
jgi:hypothetical protein